MNIIFNYLDEQIHISVEKVFALEVLHTHYLWRIISDLTSIVQGNYIEDVQIVDDALDELNIYGKILIIMDYFHMDINSKKNLGLLNKYVLSQIDDKMLVDCSNFYRKMLDKMNHMLIDIDLPIIIDDEFDFENFLKIFKISFKQEEKLFKRLCLLIDVEKIFHIHSLLVFINVKQFLSLDEVYELEKYAVYNSVSLLLIDSQSYGECLDFERKLLIDTDLSEVVL